MDIELNAMDLFDRGDHVIIKILKISAHFVNEIVHFSMKQRNISLRDRNNLSSQTIRSSDQYVTTKERGGRRGSSAPPHRTYTLRYSGHYIVLKKNNVFKYDIEKSQILIAVRMFNLNSNNKI